MLQQSKKAYLPAQLKLPLKCEGPDKNAQQRFPLSPISLSENILERGHSLKTTSLTAELFFN